MSKYETKEEKLNVTKAYSLKYRIFKTLLLILAWISFGVNNEIISSTLEDLRILLNLNYERVSFLLVVKSIGYLVTICFSGILYDRLSKFSEMIMSISCLLKILRNLKFNGFIRKIAVLSFIFIKYNIPHLLVQLPRKIL